MQKTTKLLILIEGIVLLFAANVVVANPPAETTTLYLPTTDASNPYTGKSGDISPTDNYWDPNSQGGEFTAFVQNGPNYAANYNAKAKAQIDINGTVETGFETFCVEMNQTMTPGVAYNTAVEPTAILPDGGNVSLGTAYLYGLFATAALPSYTYASGTGREKSADELQDAIWYLQGEISAGYNDGGKELYTFQTSDPFLELATNYFGSLSKAESSDAGDTFGVEVLELTSATGTSVQDQLVYCPVPEPATFAAGAMLLAPLGWSVFRMIRKRNSPSDLAILLSNGPHMAPVRERPENRQRNGAIGDG